MKIERGRFTAKDLGYDRYLSKQFRSPSEAVTRGDVAGGDLGGLYPRPTVNWGNMKAPVYSTVTSSTALSTGNSAVFVDASNGAITITLPSAGTNAGKHFIIKKIDSSTNPVNIDGNGTETIDNYSSISITTQYESYKLMSDGGEWYII